MPAFWHWFVAIGTVVFTIWCIWLVSWSAKQGPQNVADDDLVGHKWDGDLEEWNNPAPKWWLYLYFITIVWGIGYMIAYPGIGAFDGVLGWSQEGQYEQEMQAATNVPIDMIQIVQSLVIVFIAAPALIRALWRVRTTATERPEGVAA